MAENLETIKKNLPLGYERTIAETLGCSQGTVHNVMNGKKCGRSAWKVKVLQEASRMAATQMKAIKAATQVADKLNELQNGIAS